MTPFASGRALNATLARVWTPAAVAVGLAVSIVLMATLLELLTHGAMAVLGLVI